MLRKPWRVTRANALLAVASLAVAAPLALPEVGSVSTLFARSPEPGYLLYPHLGLCMAGRTKVSQADASAVRGSARAFRPTLTADAVMPPSLGQSLAHSWLGADSGSSDGFLLAADTENDGNRTERAPR
jgi:hypothetical protein